MSEAAEVNSYPGKLATMQCKYNLIHGVFIYDVCVNFAGQGDLKYRDYPVL